MLLLVFWFMVFPAAWVLALRGLAAAGIVIDVPAPWMMVAMQLGFFLLPLVVWLFIKRDSLRNHLPNMPLGGVNFVYIFFISILLQPMMMAVVLLTNFIFPNNVAELIGGLAHYPWWLMILAVAVMPAVCEEIVFRGYIQSKHRHMSLKKMAVLNGLFFAIIHMNPHQFFYAFILGIIFVYMVHYTKSIWSAVISHFVINASQVSLVYFAAFLESIIEQPYEEAEALAQQAAMDVAGVVFLVVTLLACTAGAVMLFRLFIAHNKSRVENEEMPEVTSKVRFFDGYVIAVIVLYLLLTIVLPMVMEMLYGVLSYAPPAF